MEAQILVTTHSCEVHVKAHSAKGEKLISINDANAVRLLSYLSGVDQIRLYTHCIERLSRTLDKTLTVLSDNYDRHEMAIGLKSLVSDVIEFKVASTRKSSGSRVQGAVAKVHGICAKMKDSPRKEIIAACVEAGINKGTAGVQYAAWRKVNG